VHNLLNNKVAVVTGANRGIGKSIVETFVRNGAMVIACVRTVSSDVELWAQEMGKKSKKPIVLVSVDLSDENSIKDLVKRIYTISKKVDILVNNAGIASGSLFHMTTMSELKNVFEINFFGQITVSQGISRIMMRNKSGSIINISSTAAFIADQGTLSYGASKAAFARATKSMAVELGVAGIRVNAIAPSITKTDMFDQMSEDARNKLIKSSVLKRYAEPQDIANTALFLASDLSTYITGQTLRVDGGII